MRQPGILWLLLMELNSMQHSFAPGTLRMLIGRIVVDDDDVLTACEVHQLLVKLRRGVRSCRHIGIVGPHQFDTAHIHFLQLIEVGHPAVFFFQVVVHDLGAQYLAQ